MNNLILTEHISKSYNDKTNCIQNCNIQISSGEIYFIIGKSGSGKSTLLNILGGLEPPSKGKVFFNNISIYDINSKKKSEIIGNNFGHIFQMFYLLPELCVKDNILLSMSIINKKVDDKYFKTIIEFLDIYDILQLYPNELSGGEMQRVAIARALIKKPQIIFADEPTGNLDSINGNKVLELFYKINELFNTTIIIVTHDQDLIKYGKNIYTIKDGVLYKY